MTCLFGAASQQSASPDQLLESSFQLELKADYLRDIAQRAQQRDLSITGKKEYKEVVSSENGLQFLLNCSKSKED